MAPSKKSAKPATKATPKASKAPAKPAVKAPAKASKAPVKPVAKAVAAKKTASKPAIKVVASKPATKAKATPTHDAAAAHAASAHLHAIPSSPRSNAPTPAWIDNAITYAQKNPAVSLVSLIAVILGLLLLLD